MAVQPTTEQASRLGRWRLAVNATRAAIAGLLGKQFGGDRDLYEVLGYKSTLRFSDFEAKYIRQDLATRIVEAAPNSTWRGDIRVTEDRDSDADTPFEQAWMALNARSRVLHYLARADRVSGIGRYGILLIGLNDGRPLSDPATAARDPNNPILYLKALSEGAATIEAFDEDITSPRYGLPLYYSVNLLTEQGTGNLRSQKVHFSRVVHLADNKASDDVYGKPRLESVYNRLDDLDKVVGGTPEMYWKNAVRGMHVNVDPEYQLGDLAGDMTDPMDDLQDELDQYDHGLRRWIRTQGVTIQPLGGEVPDPRGTFDMLISVVSGTSGIPKRMLIGSERGELASSQDEVNWNARIKERRVQYAEPEILRVFIDRMLEWGVLPQPSTTYTIEWPSLFEASDKELSEIARLRMDALSKYTTAPEMYVSGDEVREMIGLQPMTEALRSELQAETPLDESDNEVVAQFELRGR